jgi:hypothetical protein
MYCRVVKKMLTDGSEVRTASIIRAMTALMMEVVRQYIPEDTKLRD